MSQRRFYVISEPQGRNDISFWTSMTNTKYAYFTFTSNKPDLILSIHDRFFDKMKHSIVEGCTKSNEFWWRLEVDYPTSLQCFDILFFFAFKNVVREICKSRHKRKIKIYHSFKQLSREFFLTFEQRWTPGQLLDGMPRIKFFFKNTIYMYM